MISRNQRFQKCYVADGNTLSTYKNTGSSGKFAIEENKKYNIEITIYDAFNNNSTLNFTINGKKPETTFVSNDLSTGGYRIFENILKVKSKFKKDTTAQFYSSGSATNLSPAYQVNGYPVYLYDLRKGLIDSARIVTQAEEFNFYTTLFPGIQKEIVYNNYKIKFTDSSLYDTLYLQLKKPKGNSEKDFINIHNATVPMSGKIELSYSDREAGTLNPRSYLALNGRKYEESLIADNVIHSKVKYLGQFGVCIDTLKPVVKYVTHGTKAIRFNIYDRNSGIGSFSATLNGEWILMNYEHKTSTLWSEMQDKSKPLKGKFVLEVTDKAGNVTRFEKVL
jgi:hypothetical protein